AQSAGIPRNINNLCFNAMSLACALKKTQVDASMVRETIQDLDLSTVSESALQLSPLHVSSAIRARLRFFYSWRYRAVIAIALFMDLGLLAYNEIPSHLEHRNTIGGAREPNASAAVKAIAQEDLDNLPVSPQPQTPAPQPAPLSASIFKTHHESGGESVSK